MELRHLRYFISVADELSFSRAAEKLNISQPPLSQQIKKLELELGLQLFRRVARGVELTQEGVVLSLYARRLMHDAEQLRSLAERLRGGEEGTLRLGVVGTSLLGELPALMRTIRAHMPLVTFQLEEIESGDQVKALLEHRIDVGVLRPPVEADSLELFPLSEEALVAAIPSDHPLAQRPLIRVADLKDEPFILFPRPLGEGLYDAVVSACASAGYSPRIIHETDRMQTVVGLVATGAGVSIVPECVMRVSLPGVAYVSLGDSAPKSALSFAWSREAMNPVLMRFAKLVAALLSLNPPVGC